MKGISTRRQVIIAAHSVFRGQIERWYDTWGRHGAVSSPLPVDLPARRSSPGDGIVPWPLLFLLGVFALLTVLQQLWRDYGVGHQTKGLREETDTGEEGQSFSFAAKGLKVRSSARPATCKMVHMLHGHAVNFDDILSKKPYSVNEQVSTLKGKHVKGGHEGLLCNYGDVINVDDQWDCQAWDHVRALLRDRLRKKFRMSSSNLLDVRKLNGKREVCAPPHIRSILPADDKEREMYNICKRVVTILEPYGELMGSDLKVHPYQGRLIPWKSIEVLSMELRYFFDTLRETYRLDGSASETEASENFIEDMAVSLAGEVKRAVFEIGFYSSSFCSPPSTSSPAQKDSTSAVLDGM